MVAEVGNVASQASEVLGRRSNGASGNSTPQPTSRPTPGLAFVPGSAPAPATKQNAASIDLTTIKSTFGSLQSATDKHDSALNKLHDAQEKLREAKGRKEKQNVLDVLNAQVSDLRAKFGEASTALDAAKLDFYVVVAMTLDKLRRGKDDFTSARNAGDALDQAVRADGDKTSGPKNAADAQQMAVREQINSYVLIVAKDKLKALTVSAIAPDKRVRVIADVASWVVTRQGYPSPTDALPIARLSALLYHIKDGATGANKAASIRLQADLVNACKKAGIQISPDQQQQLNNVSLIVPG